MDEKELLEIIEEAAKDGRKELTLTHKGITEIPSEIGQLKNLTELDLDGNQLTSVPAEIGQLKNLTKLDLGGNHLSSLPDEIGQLKNLSELSLPENRLSSLSAEIGKLKNLTELYLGGNQLRSLPAEIGQLKNLTEFYLGGNQLSSLTVEIGQLKKLTELYLGGNHLSSLPAEIGQLRNLTELSLPENQLSSLPAEIGQLKNLTELYLGGNQIRSLPVEVGQLKNLIKLDMSENQLSFLPVEIGQLKSLIKLGLSENQLSLLPSEIGQLKNLTELYLGGNHLSSLPSEIGQLKNLTELSFSENHLSSLPSEIGQLKNLTELYLGGNQLISLPAEIGQLTKLEYLDLGDNPLEFPPPEVVKQGKKAILSYLRELEKGKKERYEAKLLILGDGGEGKTCVSRALRNLPFKKQIRTEGIEIEQWNFENMKFPGEKDKEITLYIWDFEGQEINHQSHQFFLTEKSLYLLVINGRRAFKKEKAEYWLDTIRSRAPGSKVILVASECENTTPSWPLDKLKQEYKDLLQGENWYFAVGCQTLKGIDELATEIKTAASKMKTMGLDWPESYQNAEDKIRRCADTDAQVNRANLYEIFRETGINEENFENVAEQMDRLGIITQFADSPALGDFVVLNPQWLTKGISLVMEDEQLKDDKGEISHERMRGIWDEEYTGLYPFFHNCMKEFELCYDMEDMAGCLVPLRFGDVRPDIPWSEIPGAKERRIEYKLNIHPPKGIMSRFIVKTHHMIAKTEQMPKGVYWDKGVFLRTGEGEYRSESLCEFIEEDRTILINVRAAFPQNMVEQLHGFAKAVFNFFDGLEPERSYGCKKFEETKETECEGAHAERRILFALSRDKEIDCDRGWHVVDPKRLVYGFSSFGEAAFTVKELREELNKKPEWAEGLVGDVMSSLVGIDKVYNKVVEIQKQHKELSAEVCQEIELKMRDHIQLMNEMLDNRDFNSTPAVISIEAVDGSKFNPKDWFEKKYVLIPYCEREGGVHPVEFTVPFKKPREWWIKTAPKLSMAIKMLSAGVQIACAGLPLTVKPEVFEAVKNHVEFMNELAGHLELEGGAESDISKEAGQTVEKMKGKSSLRDLRQLSGEDEKRIVRMQLAELLSEIAPDNYKARQWGPLKRLRMPDNTYRWLCKEHAEEYKK